MSLLDALHELSRDEEPSSDSVLLTQTILIGILELILYTAIDSQGGFEDDRDVRRLTRCI